MKKMDDWHRRLMTSVEGEAEFDWINNTEKKQRDTASEFVPYNIDGDLDEDDDDLGYDDDDDEDDDHSIFDDLDDDDDLGYDDDHSIFDDIDDDDGDDNSISNLDDDDEDDEDNDDCDDDEDIESLSGVNPNEVKLKPSQTGFFEFSKKKPKPPQMPTDGFFKYYDDGRWNLQQALFDQFAELKARYDINSCSNWCYWIIIGEEGKKRDYERALMYYGWLIDNFPFEQVFQLQGKEGWETIRELVSYVLWRMAPDYFDKQLSQIYYDFVNSHPKLYDVLFKTKWKEIDVFEVGSYLLAFVNMQDFDKVRQLFEVMEQNGSFFANDEQKDEFLEWILTNEQTNEQRRQGQHGAFHWGVEYSDEAYEFFLNWLNELSFDTPQARQKLKMHAPEDTCDCIENELEELEIEINGLLYQKQQLLKKLKRRGGNEKG